MDNQQKISKKVTQIKEKLNELSVTYNKLAQINQNITPQCR